MRRLVCSPRAISDLHDITRYGRREVGEAQARRYAVAIETVGVKLADGRLRGRPSDDPIPGLLEAEGGLAPDFFPLWAAGTPEIVRVLHGKMNIEDHL